MSTKPIAESFFASAKVNITEAPTNTVAECTMRIQPSISFNPSDPVSVLRAKRVALNHTNVPRFCGEACPTAPIPCTLRMLEDEDYLNIVRTFRS